MRIETERLTIRPFASKDRAAMLGMLSNEIISRTYMIPVFESEAEAVRLFERFVELSLSEVCIAAGIDLNGQLIGFIHDVGIEAERIELGYVIDPECHRRGFMTEALRAVIEYLFSRGFRVVAAGAFAENTASIRVMEKCGMQRIEKTETIAYRNKLHDCVYYAISCDDM